MAERNLRAEKASLRARVRRIEARLAVPASGKSGRTRGYASLLESGTIADSGPDCSTGPS